MNEPRKEYRIEVRHTSEPYTWYSFDGSAQESKEEAVTMEAEVREFYNDKTRQIRIASRVVSDWAPEPTPVQSAALRLQEAMSCHDRLQLSDIRMLIGAVLEKEES